LENKAKILVVDDEDLARGFLFALLTQDGYKVFEAEDAEKALKIMAQDSIDLVISDINMPGLDGIELLKRIKTNWEDTEVVLMTGYHDVATGGDIVSCGAYDLIKKPITDIEGFLKIVKKALNLSEISKMYNELLIRG